MFTGEPLKQCSLHFGVQQRIWTSSGRGRRAYQASPHPGDVNGAGAQLEKKGST